MRKTELPNCPQWLLDADTVGEDVTLSDSGRVVWRGGVWRGGDWWSGVWHGEKVLASGSFGPMKSSGRLCYYILTETHEMVRAGCFAGTIAELRARAEAEEKPDYLELCDILQTMIEKRRLRK